MNDIANLLGTKDKKEQARRIENLQQAVTIQPVDLIMRYDPRINQITDMAAVGGKLGADQIRIILRAAEEMLRQLELKAATELSASKEEENAG